MRTILTASAALILTWPLKLTSRDGDDEEAPRFETDPSQVPEPPGGSLRPGTPGARAEETRSCRARSPTSAQRLGRADRRRSRSPRPTCGARR